jgi:hypothetical protein
MTIGKLRWMIVATLLSMSAVTILFFITAQPVFGYPIDPSQAWILAQISIPVFTGYLGTATQFAMTEPKDGGAKAPPLLLLLVFGPVAIYLIGALVILYVFWLTNRPEAPDGTGISVGLLSTILTTLLGIVTATANIAIAQLFKKPAD